MDIWKQLCMGARERLSRTDVAMGATLTSLFLPATNGI